MVQHRFYIALASSSKEALANLAFAELHDVSGMKYQHIDVYNDGNILLANLSTIKALALL